MDAIGSYLEKAWSWLKPYVTPDMGWEFWWIIAITIPLTLAWMFLSKAEVKKFFNDRGGEIVFGTLALVILLAFVSPFLTVLVVIANVAGKLLNLSMNLSLRGVLSMLWLLITLTPFLIAVWLINKFLEKPINQWINLGKTIAGKIWSQHEKVKAKPSLFWVCIGGAVIAMAINSKWAVHITGRHAFPGLIPIISAAVGAFFLVWRTVLGRRMTELATARVLNTPVASTDEVICPNKACAENPMPLLDEKLQPVRNQNGKIKGVISGRCGQVYHKKHRVCPNPRCRHPNPYWQICTACGFAGEDGQGYRRAKPHLPDVCPECGNIHPPIPAWTKFVLPGKKGKQLPAAKPVPMLPAPGQGTMYCPYCGAGYDPGQKGKKCRKCGEPLAEPKRPAGDPAPAAAPPAPPPAASTEDAEEVSDEEVGKAWDRL